MNNVVLHPLVAMNAIKALGSPGRFPLFQLLNAQNQQEMVAAGTAIMTTAIDGSPVMLPANNGVAIGAPANPAAPANTQVSINDQVDSIKDELRQFTNKAVGQSESRVRDDINALKALIVASNPPPKKTPKKPK